MKCTVCGKRKCSQSSLKPKPLCWEKQLCMKCFRERYPDLYKVRGRKVNIEDMSS